MTYMESFEWDRSLEERKRALSQTAPLMRAQELSSRCRDGGFLIGRGDEEILGYITQRIEKRGYVRSLEVLRHFHEALSFDIEGDFYEPGSYVGILNAFFVITGGEVTPSNILDDVDNKNMRLSVSFEWKNKPFAVTIRPEVPTDGFDERIVAHINDFLLQQSMTKQFLPLFSIEMDQILHWIFLDPARKKELQEMNLLIFGEQIPYSRRALDFVW